jgi:hypothetical protein
MKGYLARFQNPGDSQAKSFTKSIGGNCQNRQNLSDSSFSTGFGGFGSSVLKTFENIRPVLGSISNPMPVIARKMPVECLWDDCEGDLSGKGNLYKCAKCQSWFELKTPEDM